MSVLFRWRKGISATSADLDLPAAGSAPVSVPGVERGPRGWRRLTPKRVAVGSVKTVFKLGFTMVIVVVVGLVPVTTAIATYVLLPLPVNLPDERIQPE